MSKDNWEHRRVNMKCVTCMWFVQKKGIVGRCKKNAPTMNGFPVVFDTDWCGQHKLNEDTVDEE